MALEERSEGDERVDHASIRGIAQQTEGRIRTLALGKRVPDSRTA